LSALSTGPIFHFSDTWQLIINTGTTIVTFLMVFVIQNTQNRDGAAIQAKLEELIGAQNRFIGIEHLTDVNRAIQEKLRGPCGQSSRPREQARRRTQEILMRAVSCRVL